MAITLNSISRSLGFKAPALVIHGPSGVGKTSLGAGAPNPIFICTEDGLGKLEVDAFPLKTSGTAEASCSPSTYGDSY